MGDGTILVRRREVCFQRDGLVVVLDGRFIVAHALVNIAPIAVGLGGTGLKGDGLVVVFDGRVGLAHGLVGCAAVIVDLDEIVPEQKSMVIVPDGRFVLSSAVVGFAKAQVGAVVQRAIPDSIIPDGKLRLVDLVPAVGSPAQYRGDGRNEVYQSELAI